MYIQKQKKKVELGMTRKESRNLVKEITLLERKVIRYEHELKAKQNWTLKFQIEFENLLFEKQELEQELVKVEQTLGNAEQVNPFSE